MSKREKDNITLGSGKLYHMEYTGTLPSVEDICKEENHAGWIKGGASLEYTMEKYEEKDDLGMVTKTITTKEDALLKCGLLTWNGETLTKLTDRATTSTESGKRVTKIGGTGNANKGNYVWCFHHEDDEGGDLWVLIVGSNQKGFTLTLATDSGTVIEPEIKAIPHDKDGTLIELIEEIADAAA